MGKRNRFEYIVKNCDGTIIYSGNVVDVANNFNVVQNVVYEDWKHKRKMLGMYTIERIEVDPYIPPEHEIFKKAFNLACSIIAKNSNLSIREVSEKLLQEVKKWINQTKVIKSILLVL